MASQTAKLVEQLALVKGEIMELLKVKDDIDLMDDAELSLYVTCFLPVVRLPG